MAWTPPSLPDSIVLMSGVAAQCNATQCWTPELTAEILPGNKVYIIHSSPGGSTFALKHGGSDPCGISDGETFVLTGGRDVTR